MKRVPLEGQFGKLCVRHLETSFVGILVQLGTDVEPCFGGRAADQIDHDLAADQGTSAPVVGDVAEHPMFDLVPLAGSRWKVTDLDREAEVIGQLLHLAFPQADPIAVAAATIRRNQQAAGMGIAGLAHFFPPAPDAFDREFGGVVIDPNADPPLIGCDIVDAIGRDLAEVRIKEIMDANVLGLSLGLPLLAAVLESADQCLFVDVRLYQDWTDTLTLFADGHDIPPDIRADLARRNILVVDGRITEIAHRGGHNATVKLDTGRNVAVDILFAHPRNKPSASLHESLGLVTADTPLGMVLKVDERRETSMPGIYAAGDLANPLMSSVTTASSHGAMAGIFAQQSMLV